MLGSASIEARIAGDGPEEKTVVFSGDLGPAGLPILKDPEPFGCADAVVLESTYGDRDHRSLDATRAEFRAIIEEAIATRAKIFVPSALHVDPTATAPLYYSAGYELDDGAAGLVLSRGWIVVTPHQIEANPLVRTPNCDVALLHLARSLPFVDDSRVLIAGGSAGGTMTLMLAAETDEFAGACRGVAGRQGKNFGWPRASRAGPASKLPRGGMAQEEQNAAGGDKDEGLPAAVHGVRKNGEDRGVWKGSRTRRA